nr:EcoRII N-terminal effector-binding domain-containing protein [uncultured Sphingobacterium sp.]
MNELEKAIEAVKNYEYSFSKFISANDAGSTGAHQAGLYIPKNSYQLLFDTPGNKGSNREQIGHIIWSDGMIVECRLKYYGGGTRNEYRMTRMGKSFTEGELVILVKTSIDRFLGFLLKDLISINAFLGYFGMTRSDTNSLIRNRYMIDSRESLSIQTVQTPLVQVSSVNEQRMQMSFRPKAHILTLLGEELIKDPVMAIYELVKNSYDADADTINVSFSDINSINDAKITIIDSGTGMTSEILENVWLEPGTAHRKPFDDNGMRIIKRSPIYNRVPMGEKGVGRFAVHKLGNKINLISRPSKVLLDENGNFLKKELLNYEIEIEIDWRKFTQSRYLSEINIEWKKNEDKNSFFFKENSGTKIEISALKETWSRGMARQLKRHTISMVSPKNDPSKFLISLDFKNNWLDRFPDVNEIIQQAPYKLTAFIDREFNLTLEYIFRLANNEDIGFREIKGDKEYDRNIRGSLRPRLRDYFNEKGFEDDELEEKIESLLAKPIPFGDLLLELYSYDLDAASLRDVTYTPDILRKTLKDQHGIKVFKDDLRVYDYGEAGNDWLGLDIKRVQNKEWFSNNQNIGFIYLDSETSGSLVEKTNREGFISNESFDVFKLILEFIFNEFRIERQKDRTQWRNFNAVSKTTKFFGDRIQRFVGLIDDAGITDPEKKQKLLDEAESIEADYEKTKDTLLIPAGVGMTASVAMHEIEKLVPRMEETTSANLIDADKIRDQVIELDTYVQGILSVLKQSGVKPVDLREAINQSVVNYELKLSRRKIEVTLDIEDEVDTVLCDKRFLVTILMNLIDNSIHWLDTVYKANKEILIKAFKQDAVTHIIIADNGPGFRDSAEEIVAPFFSRRDGGIGIGMYLVDTIMLKYGKLIIYSQNIDADLDQKFDGAIVELIFNKNLN